MYSSPFRHSSIVSSPEGSETTFPYDLHVLATPPAFDLSQDQTLHLIFIPSRPEGQEWGSSVESYFHGLSELLGVLRLGLSSEEERLGTQNLEREPGTSQILVKSRGF